MRKIEKLMRDKAAKLLASGAVDRVLAWRRGEFFYDNMPAFFAEAEECGQIVYDEFCPANLCKYLLQSSSKGLKTAVFLKPCDTYGVNQLLKDNRIRRELIHAVGIPCSGMLDIKKIKNAGAKGIIKIETTADDVIVTTVLGKLKLAKAEMLLDKCRMCKGNDYKTADEELGEKLPTPVSGGDKFAGVKAIEAMSPKEKFAFWQAELSKCIRCNACRDICPACTCEQCIFDHPESPVAGKAYADPVEEQFFHIIRAYHVAGRCVGCGECARVCPQGVKLGLLNMKFIKDINTFFGPCQAGADAVTPAPLVDYKQNDYEVNIAAAHWGGK